MIALLDTHTLLWFLQGDPQLSPTAKAWIEDRSNTPLVSVVCCWEIAIKAGTKKLNLAEPSRTFLERELPKNDLPLFEINLQHATAVEHLPMHQRDPFDRLLIAQAIEEGLPLISNDSVFDRYAITRIW
jgi:PIN domain nuclease of toxin-antitoxin system